MPPTVQRALLATCVLLVGARLAFALEHRSVPWAGALLAAGAAAGRLHGRSGACLALGLLAVWGRPGLGSEPPEGVDPRRPVLVSGVQQSGWERTEYGWQTRLRVRRVVQDRRAPPWRWTLAVTVGSRETPPSGGVLRCRGFLRRAAPLVNGIKTREPPWRLAVKSTRFVSAGGSGLRRPAAARVRAALERRIDETLERPDSSGLLAALLLGKARALSRELRQELRRTGLAHLFAASGLHVALVAGGAVLVAWWLPPLARGALATVALGFYVVLIGPRPSIVRAVGMAAFAACGLLSGRLTRGIHGLAVCVFACVVVSPEIVLDLGFRLTASATAGILTLAPLFVRRWRILPRFLRAPLAVSVGAQLASAPWAWPAFGFVTPLAPILNLVAIPWVTLALAVAFLWALASLAFPSGGSLLAPLVDLTARPLRLLALLPASSVVSWPLPSAAAAVAAAALLSAALLLVRSGPRLVSLVLAVALLRGPAPARTAELTMIDVGQGDAFLVRDGGRAVLIDGGGWLHADIAARVLVPVLARRGIRSLDGAIVTHGDIDHCRGILDLSRLVPVGWVRSAPDAAGSCIEALRAGSGPAWQPVAASDTWPLGRWRIRVLHPPRDGHWSGNDGSLVLAVSGLGRRVLLTGDVERAAEKRLVTEVGAAALSADILKLAHHGSGTSTSAAFLAAVAPRLALASAGYGNRYGHPSARVVTRVAAAGSVLLRTDRDGMVEIGVGPSGTTRLRVMGP